ncbi:MAG TPA: threonine--tRNA ligase [Patescibacteria group bacterium]|nr:threonine--tRNA ligase [Patescibacteria group bacterium]
MNKDQKERVDTLRHSASHVLAAAVLRLYPGTNLGVGPAIEDGFYYDFEFPKPITEDDLPKIEEEMKKIVEEKHPFVRSEKSLKDAKAWSKKINQPYKLELLEQIEKTGDTAVVDAGTVAKKNAPKVDSVSFYQSGEFVDLCRGPHVASTKDVKVFKLLSVAGAYWRGSENNPMLTRIYGTAFESDRELDEYLVLQEEAKKRDHRMLGKKLDLFVFSQLVGGGLPLWTPKGTILRNLLDEFVWSLRKQKGYQKVTIPHITRKELYETSGHWEKFANELFKIESREGHFFAMKPMNCPHHTQIYASKQRSYREMPVRFCETTMCYRDEQSGELSGLSRVRAFTQDDAHVFLRKSQVEDEFLATWDIIDEFYRAFGFELQVRLSLHDPGHMEKYLGTKDVWKDAEAQLRNVVKKRKTNAYEAPGEAAMYGPKIDFMAKDALQREWQVATIQLDLNMPKRFGLSCINEKGEKEDIVMMHCAIMGSIERFLSILIEHYAGKFPVWLAPIQMVVIPIADRHLKYAHAVAKRLSDGDMRVEVDDQTESMQLKIRNAQLMQVPYMLVVGDREETSQAVSVRLRSGEDLKAMPIVDFIARVKEEVAKRT